MYYRKANRILNVTLGDEIAHGSVHTMVFPSVNQAKRYNRLKLGGKALATAMVPKMPQGTVKTEEHLRCDKEG